MSDQIQLKTVVTVSEMAKMVGLSRARFYQLVQVGVFPPPVYSLSNRRPIYVEELQEICLEVRRRNCGINGQPTLFYAKSNHPIRQSKPTSKAKRQPTIKGRYEDVLDGLRALGLAAVSADQVEAAVKVIFPGGLDGVDRGQVIRAVFLRIKRQDTGDNVGR
ncbi:MAG: helix-turn-helix transcriptional regulator [Thermoguttaceae bacterium]